MDLNVYFDIAKRRQYVDQAEELFRSALAGTIKILVADEFVRELRKSAKDLHCDPILNLALCIPKLPRVDQAELKETETKIHGLVFPHLSQPTPQSRSDCVHLAHAALARSTAFVTRDGALLAASAVVLREIGLEIVSPQELFALLPSELHGVLDEQSGKGFRSQVCEVSDARKFISELGGRPHLYEPVIRLIARDNPVIRSVELAGRIEAIAVVSLPQRLGAQPELGVVCRPESPNKRLFVDHLLERLLRDASSRSPTAVRLQKIPGQAVVNEVARARGFIQPTSEWFEKLIIGRPLHPANWEQNVAALSARTGIKLTGLAGADQLNEVMVEANGATRQVHLETLEGLLGSTLIWWPSRPAVIVPIAKRYVEELLGIRTTIPFDFIENRDAAFRSLRGYVSSPRNALRMKAGALIFFYESLNGGGSGAVIAAAKIASATIVKKEVVSDDDLNHLVVDNFDKFSSSPEILISKFDNVFELGSPVPLNKLREIGAVDGANLVTAREISGGQAKVIIEFGFQS